MIKQLSPILTLAALAIAPLAVAQSAPPASDNAPGTAAKPSGSPTEWFRMEDYPADARRAMEQGRVAVSVRIDSEGHPYKCWVVTSSGSKSLDDATCTLVMTRASFIPAKDKAGKPMEWTYNVSTRWSLQDDTPQVALPLRSKGVALGNPASWFSNDSYPVEARKRGQSGRVGIALTINASGQPVACDVVSSSGYAELDQGTCDLAMERGRFAAPRDANNVAVPFRYMIATTWLKR